MVLSVTFGHGFLTIPFWYENMFCARKTLIFIVSCLISQNVHNIHEHSVCSGRKISSRNIEMLFRVNPLIVCLCPCLCGDKIRPSAVLSGLLMSHCSSDFFLTIETLFDTYGCFVSMYVSTLHACLVPTKARSQY